MRLLERGPTGKFIGHRAALYCWLPILLDSFYSSNPLLAMLSIGANWCLRKASHAYSAAGDTTQEGNLEMADFWLKEAATWRIRREILIETAEKIAK